MIDLVLRGTRLQGAPARSFVYDVLEKTTDVVGLSSEELEVSVSFVQNERIRALNKAHRSVDEETDVLSFPLHDWSHTAGLGVERIPRYNGRALGDIFISPARVRADAHATNTPERQRMAWVLVHGFLHLLGYDHEQSVRAAHTMEDLERRVLVKLSF